MSSDYPHEIALAIRLGVPHLERIAHGIREYAGAKTNWRFLMNPETHDLPPTALKGWQGDGVIALCNTREDEHVLENLGCPVVNISGAIRKTRFARVRNDYEAIGRKAAKYFWQRGFRRVGFYGVQGVWYSSEIERGFAQTLAELGGASARVIHSASTIGETPNWNQGQEELELWLSSMEPPFAVLAAHDPRATMVIRACERVGLRVPNDVAVLGVNDDTSTCESSFPTLSSIERNGRELGRRVARHLDELIRGDFTATASDAEKEIVIAPGEIVQRESTQAFAVDHPQLRRAVQFVEARFRESISIEEIADSCGKSRRWLEEVFRKQLDRSPSEFLRELRVECAREILEEDPQLKLVDLARAVGFSNGRQMNAAFLKVVGAKPRELETR